MRRWTKAGDRWVAPMGVAVAEIRQPDERYLVDLIDTRKPWRGFSMRFSYHTSLRAAKRAALSEARRIGCFDESVLAGARQGGE